MGAVGGFGSNLSMERKNFNTISKFDSRIFYNTSVYNPKGSIGPNTHPQDVSLSVVIGVQGWIGGGALPGFVHNTWFPIFRTDKFP